MVLVIFKKGIEVYFLQSEKNHSDQMCLVLITTNQKWFKETSILEKEKWEMSLILLTKHRGWKDGDWEKKWSDINKIMRMQWGRALLLLLLFYVIHEN